MSDGFCLTMRAASARPISGYILATTLCPIASCIAKTSDISPSMVSVQRRWPVAVSVRLAVILICRPARRIVPEIAYAAPTVSAISRRRPSRSVTQPIASGPITGNHRHIDSDVLRSTTKPVAKAIFSSSAPAGTNPITRTDGLRNMSCAASSVLGETLSAEPVSVRVDPISLRQSSKGSDFRSSPSRKSPSSIFPKSLSSLLESMRTLVASATTSPESRPSILRRFESS